jgi:hypothetical protein
MTQTLFVYVCDDGRNFNAKVRDYVSMDAENTKILDCGCGPGE